MITCSKRTLVNGLRIVAVEMPHLHSAEIAFYIKVGGRDDPPGKAGLSHFLEHMLFRGTAEHATSLELETAFEAIGGSVNAATDEESTCYFSRVRPDHVPRGLELFSSMLLRPTLQGLEVEKRIICEEALEDINENGEEINTHNLASRLLWPDHPLGTPTIGYLDTIENFSRDDLLQHMNRFYTPANTVAVIAGNFPVDTAFSACESAFGAWQGGAAHLPEPPSADQISSRMIFVEDSDSQVHLQVAFRGFARPDPRIMATRLLRRMLCGSGSSRLNMLLREQLGIVYSVDASIAAYEETGSFAIELSTAPENLPLAVTEVLRETGRIAFEVATPEEMQRVRKGYLFDLGYSRDSNYEMQVRYGWGELMNLVRSIEEDQAEATEIDGEAVRAAARVLLEPRNLNLVAVGPWKSPMRREVERIVADYKRDWLARAMKSG
jgi:predicted Zn-dependent peptidase